MSLMLEMSLTLIQVIITWILWHILWEWLVYELQRDKYESLLITSVLESFLAVGAFYADVKFIGIGNADALPNSFLETLQLIITAGFFIHDTSHWEPALKLTNISQLCHNLFSLALILMVLLHGECGSFVIELNALRELPTAFLLVRYYQKQYGYNAKVIEVFYALFFIVLRFFYGSNLILVIIGHRDIPNVLKILECLIYMTSVFLLPNVLYMALTRGPRMRIRSPRSSRRSRNTIRTKRSTSRTRGARSNSRVGSRRTCISY